MRTVLALTLGLVLSSCDGTSILNPPEPEEIRIVFAISGGFSGGQGRVVVDGADGEARWICGPFCPGQTGAGVVHLSNPQVLELARQLDRSGILDLEEPDFGTECCDQPYIELTYVRGDRSIHVRGTPSRLPGELDLPIRLLSPLIIGSVPMLVSPNTVDTDWPRDSYVLGAVDVEGSQLTAEVTYSGGCGEHRLDLVAWGDWMESDPVQVRALITHEDRDDPCDGIVSRSLSFDTHPLAVAYAEAYGVPSSGKATVILRLWDPLVASPVGRLIEVELTW